MTAGTGIDGAASKGKPMTEDQLKRFLSAEIQNAMFYLDSSENIAASRFKNWQYYKRIMDDLPALKGQSSICSSEVHDYVEMMKPSLLRPFTSGDKLWDYEPPLGQDQGMAKTIGRYINEIVWKKDNRGEAILNDWLHTALLQKNGIVKVYWHEDRDFHDQTFDGLTDAEWLQLQSQLGSQHEITGYDRQPAPDGAGNVLNLPGAQVNLPSAYQHSVSIRTTINTSRVKIASIPVEEFIISRDARDYDSAILKCHRTWALSGDLIDQGYDPTMVNRLPTYSETRSELTRPGSTGREQNRMNIGDPSLRKVMVYEGIVRCNYDGEGVRNWYFKAGGQDGGVEVLEMEAYVAQIDFATFCPEPIPHQFVGTCPGDTLAELQRVNTTLTRQFLNNLYLSNAPQREVVAANILNPGQLTDFTPGVSILVKAAGSVQNLPLPFSAAPALEAITYFDGKAADRSGVSRSSAGLDPEALQNQSATAANLAWSASMGRMEMIARIWAYGGMRRLGQSILKCVVAYQDFPRAVKLGGEDVTVDPREWSDFTDMDVSVNTGLGTGHRDRDLAFLTQLLAFQKEVYALYGPQAAPLVTPAKIARTLQMIAECGGIGSPEGFFGNVPENWAPQPVAPQPSPDAQLKAKTEMGKAQMAHVDTTTDIAAKSQLTVRDQDIRAAIDILTAVISHDAKKMRADNGFAGRG